MKITFIVLAIIIIGLLLAIRYTNLIFIYSYFIKPSKKVKGTIRQLYLDKQTYFVYLPEGYDPKDKKKYPVIFHLHGAMPFSPKVSLPIIKKDVKFCAHLQEKMVAKGTSASTVIVAPYDGVGMSMWSDDWQNQVTAEQDLIKKLIPYIQSNYNVYAERANTTIQGFSMGGFGATKIGFKYPELFGKIISLDGAIHNWETVKEKRKNIADNVFKTEEYFIKNSPWELSRNYIKQKAHFPTKVFIVKAWVKEYNDRYRKHLEDIGIDFKFIETSCQHDVSCMMDNENVSQIYQITTNNSLHLNLD